MKEACVNCHFLAKEMRCNGGKVIVYTLNEDERKHVKLGDIECVRDEYALNCHMGVWDEGVSPDLKSRIKTLKGDRKNSCFFFAYQKRMLFGAAKELQKRACEHSQMKRTNRYAVVGLGFAAVGLFVNAVIGWIRLGMM